MFFSLIIPVYNRPQELEELLQSLTLQTQTNFEVIVVEDGSSVPADRIVDQYSQQLDIKYFSKPNSGPGQTRNFGAERARGDYFIVLDSDCIIPPAYLQEVEKELTQSPCEAWGGPDKAHDSFTSVQKAINYSMTSFFTTGGIRGGKKKLDKFYPRSFNMGVKADMYRSLSGFSPMRFGEDIDFSIRLYESKARVRLFPEAWVFHKRRVDFRKFFRQVYNFGIARINLEKRHPGSMKLVHLLPAVFTLGVIFLLLLSLFSGWFLLPLVLYCLLIFADASAKEKSVEIGAIAIVASFIQLMGYGLGFLTAVWRRLIKGEGEFGAYEKTFYK
ncbi:MAG: glycosyltransferase [Bacteroidales bacterium]